MLRVIGITMCCLIISVKSQGPYNYPTYTNDFLQRLRSQFFEPDKIYFDDTRPFVNSSPGNIIDKDIERRQIQTQQANFQAKPVKGSSGVEIEKSNELAAVTSYEVERPKNENQQLGLGQQLVGQTQRDQQKTGQQLFDQKKRDQQRAGQQVGQVQSVRQQNIGKPILQQQQNSLQQKQNSQTPQPINRIGYNNVLYSMTNFGLNLLMKINEQSSNLVISPYSITSMLALLQQGALGSTQEQITAALQITPTDSITAFTEIFDDFKKRNSRNILKTACNLFIADVFALNSGFKKIAKQNFDSDVTILSFGNPDEATRQINSWVSSRTNNKIDKLIAPGTLSQSTQVVLVNAVYFKGLWEIPFRVESTYPSDFFLSNGQKKTTQFMRMQRYFKAGTDSTTGAEVAILPFEAGQYSLMLILPSPLLGIAGTLKHTSDARLLSYFSFSPVETDLNIPKFTVKTDTDLSPALSKMGITNIFDLYPELNGIGSYREFSPRISSAVHSAVLSIDEQGGSAAAATAFAAVALSNDSPSLTFKVNRPFIAVVWDTNTSLPLFMAKIEDPVQ